jgi:hypothetical protein
MMGVADTIAGSSEGYVEIASRLAGSSDRRGEVSGRVEENRHGVYPGMERVRTPEGFFEGLARG